MDVKRISHLETRDLRHRVLWPHIHDPKDCVIDIDEREDAIHLGTFEGSKIISIGSLFRMSSPNLKFQNQYRLRAMATDPWFRGLDAGKMLVQHAVMILKEMNTEVLWCDARINATGFYARLGFNRLEQVYEIPKIGPHQFMWIEIQA